MNNWTHSQSAGRNWLPHVKMIAKRTSGIVTANGVVRFSVATDVLKVLGHIIEHGDDVAFWDNVEGLAVQVAATDGRSRDLRDNMALGQKDDAGGITRLSPSDRESSAEECPVTAYSTFHAFK
jgi:hypothetical protein